MGILQGDSPTPGPAMYWQPYHHGEETAMRFRPSAAASLGDDATENNNNNGESKLTLAVQMMHHQTSSIGQFDPTLTFQQHQAIKEEMMDVGQDTTAEEPAGAAAQQNVQESDQARGTSAGSPAASTNSNNTTPSPTLCGGCGFKIVDRYYLVAVDKAWHSECLRCDECRRPLDTAHSCFARQSRIYCREDYHRMFGGRKQCAKCCEPLQSDELVMRGREHLFHTRCFSCHVCQTHLVKGSTFGMVGALIFCQQHYLLQQQQSADQVGHLPSPPFHPHSLLQQQQQQLDQQTPSNSYLMGHHHPHHLALLHQQHLNQQEPFNSPPHHYQYDHMQQQQQPPYGGQVMMQQQQQSVETNNELPTTVGKLFGSTVPLKSPRVRTKRRPVTVPSNNNNNNNNSSSNNKSELIGTNTNNLMIERDDDSFMSADVSLDSSSSSMLNGCPGSGNQQSQSQSQKTKRLRTSFKHHQLRMLKSYFATNHNPDAKDLKQLSQKTTLSKRVLQVWFQNARAKWRRLVQKTEGGAVGAGGAGSSATPSQQHNMSSSSSNCSGSGNETGSPIPSMPHHQPSMHALQQQHQPPPAMMMGSFDYHHQQMMASRSRMSLYDDLSLSGSSSVASVGFPSPL